MRAIAAMDLNRVIGNKGKLPWPIIKEDFKWFKDMTYGCSLVMGNSTFQSVGTLPGRFTYVLTNDTDKLVLPPEKNYRYISLESLLKEPYLDNLWVVGGAKVYHLLLPYCDKLYLTLILDDYAGDTYMPEFETLLPNSEIVKESRDFWVIKYSK